MKRAPLARKTPMRQVSLKRTVTKPRRSYTGPDTSTLRLLALRSDGVCEFSSCYDEAVHTHHRRPRRLGGSSAPDTNLPSNLLRLCVEHHAWIESYRAESISRGLLLHANDVPSQVPADTRHGFVHLTDDGRVELVPPPVLRGVVLDLGGYWNPDEVA